MRLRHTEVGLPAGENWLDAILAHSPLVPGLIIEMERSGSTLVSGRGAFINGELEAAGFATLRVALLSHQEERHAPELWHQVPALVARLAAVLEWVRHQPALQNLPLGIVAREAAAAAMVRVASRSEAPLRALACRDGRPDLAGLEPLRSLGVPLLLVAGEHDHETLGSNRQAHDVLACPKGLAVVPGASRAFDELGTLEKASGHIVGWFRRWMPDDTMA